jgi:ParB-like chromosome segregation protein Spo0J
MQKTEFKIIPTNDLIPYARNSRTHSEDQVTKIASSIKEFGFLNPIIIDGENGIVAGHGRVMAAKKLGLTELPCIEASHLTEAQKRAYVIADNRLALDAGWDNDLLKIELQDLDADGFDLLLTGFDLSEINVLFDIDNAENNLPNQQELNATFEVAVECSNETEQETVFNLLIKEGYKCRILTM